MMDKSQAFSLLDDTSSHERLRAARALGRLATRRDIPALRRRLRTESVAFVRRALTQTIERLASGTSGEATSHDVETEIGQAESERAAYTRAVEWVTNSMLHEILPRVGMIKVEARRSLNDYDSSTLKKRIDDLTSVLQGIEELKRATSSGVPEEINLGSLINEIVAHEKRGTPLEVSVQGSSDLIAVADPNLLRIAISNGLRNALEATAASGWKAPVVVAFGATEVDYWITILDSGPGLAGPAEKAFEIGRTTKAGHRGFGLAIARQALATLDGDIVLQPAQSGGARLEIRWFR